jgi:hypothetical protein
MSSAAAPGSPQRRAEAERLTALMEAVSPFTYLRLGDGELQLMLEWQANEQPKAVRETASSSAIFDAFSVNGLREWDYSRLQNAFERCNYLDTFERVPYSAANFHRLRLNLNPYGTTSPHPDLSQIFYEWVYCELPHYMDRHRCVIAGAEAPLLRELLADPRYHQSTNHFWSSSPYPTCVGIRNNGRGYWDLLSEIKTDLVKTLRASQADTLFLSLASGAKILCQEIAEEVGIRCFDLGAMLLGLTYSSTPGNSIVRNSHNPFFFRVPFDVYMDAFERAYPDFSIYDLVMKAQGQLCLELLRKEIMYSFVPEIKDSRNFDQSPENLWHFRTSYEHYRRRFGSFLTKTPKGRQLSANFEKWRRDHGLGLIGKALGLARSWRSTILITARKPFPSWP